MKLPRYAIGPFAFYYFPKHQVERIAAALQGSTPTWVEAILASRAKRQDAVCFDDF